MTRANATPPAADPLAALHRARRGASGGCHRARCNEPGTPVTGRPSTNRPSRSPMLLRRQLRGSNDDRRPARPAVFSLPPEWPDGRLPPQDREAPQAPPNPTITPMRRSSGARSRRTGRPTTTAADFSKSDWNPRGSLADSTIRVQGLGDHQVVQARTASRTGIGAVRATSGSARPVHRVRTTPVGSDLLTMPAQYRGLEPRRLQRTTTTPDRASRSGVWHLCDDVAPRDRPCQRRRPPVETSRMIEPPPDPAMPADATAHAAEVADPGPAVADLDTIVSLSKRRGFIFPSSEIYGGINAVWDYGPLGVELKNNVKRAWWRAMVQERDDIVGLDAGILMHPQVWVTSGHVGSFSDPLVECADLPSPLPARRAAGRRGALARPTCATRRSSSGWACAAPSTAARCRRRGASTSCSRRSWARSRRTPRSSTCAPRPRRAPTSTSRTSSRRAARRCPSASPRSASRSATRSAPATSSSGCASSSRWRCSTSCAPGEPAAAAFEEWLPARRAWYERYGVTPERLRFREHAPDELAHYAKKAIDVEYRFPFGWKELEGIHNRGDFDLGSHARASGENLEYFDPATEEKFIPWVVETAAGADRAAFTFLIDAYREEEVRGETRVVLRLHPDLAPYKVAVLPLLKKRPEIVELCHRIKADLKRDLMAVYDDTAADRQALPPPGRDRHAVVRDGRRRLPRGRCGDDPGPRRDDPGAGAGRRRQARDPRPDGRRPGRVAARGQASGHSAIDTRCGLVPLRHHPMVEPADRRRSRVRTCSGAAAERSDGSSGVGTWRSGCDPIARSRWGTIRWAKVASGSMVASPSMERSRWGTCRLRRWMGRARLRTGPAVMAGAARLVPFVNSRHGARGGA